MDDDLRPTPPSSTGLAGRLLVMAALALALMSREARCGSSGVWRPLDPPSNFQIKNKFTKSVRGNNNFGSRCSTKRYHSTTPRESELLGAPDFTNFHQPKPKMPQQKRTIRRRGGEVGSWYVVRGTPAGQLDGCV